MVYPIIVTYNPNIELLKRQFDALSSQVDGILYIENGSRNQCEVVDFINTYAKKKLSTVELILNDKNIGLGAAQNIGIDIAEERGIDHVIFFDQDSTPDADFVKTMMQVESELLAAGKNVSVVAPVAIEEESGKICGVTVHEKFFNRERVFPKEGETSVLWVMASGSLFRTEVFKTIGKMNEHFFVDMIDTEWGYRAKTKGYENFVTARARMMHNVGDSVKQVGNQQMHLHSADRMYYHARNNIVQLYNPAYGGHHIRVATRTFLRILARIAIYGSMRKWGHVRAGFDGLRKGIFMKLGQKGKEYRYSFKSDVVNYSGVKYKAK